MAIWGYLRYTKSSPNAQKVFERIRRIFFELFYLLKQGNKEMYTQQFSNRRRQSYENTSLLTKRIIVVKDDRFASSRHELFRTSTHSENTGKEFMRPWRRRKETLGVFSLYAKRYKSVYISVNNNTNLNLFKILSNYIIWDRLSQNTISRYCPF